MAWTSQFGSSGSDYANGVAVDAAGIYVVGYSSGVMPSGSLPANTNKGGYDPFVSKFTSAGAMAWTSQFGSSSGSDYANGVAVDASGVYVAGRTSGTLPGQTSAGGVDALVRKFDSAGSVVWTRQFGSSGSDYANGVAANAAGVYVAGYTTDAVPGQTSTGSNDGF